MKQIKFLSLLLAFVMILTAQIIPICAAEPSTTLTVVQSEITDVNGAIEIRLDSTEDILGGSFNLIYDPSVLAVDGYKNSSGFTCQVNTQYAFGCIRVSFAGSRGIKTGEVISIIFVPLVNDSCTTKISLEEVNLHNAQAKNVECTGVGAVCDVTVLKPIGNVELSASDLTLGVGEQMPLFYQLDPEDASVDSVSWSVSNTSVATIDQNGVITAVRVGSTQVTCTITDRFFNTYIKRASVTVYAKPNVTAMGGYVVPGESITVAVRLDTVGTTYTSGSFNFVYDPELLSLESAVVGSLISGCMTTLNPSYRENKVRLNFLGQHGVKGSGEICQLTFKALKEGQAEIVAEESVLNTDGGLEHVANEGAGVISIGSYGLSIEKTEQTVAWTEFSLPISFDAAPGVAGGSFVISYDSQKLRFLGSSDLLSGFAVTVNNEYGEGKIKISFAGTQGIAQGTLVCLRFTTLENPTDGIITEVTFSDGPILLYTQSGMQIIPSHTDVSLTVAYNEIPLESGDADCNGVIDTRDATAILKYIQGNSDAIWMDTFADLNKDGNVDDADMDYLMKLLAGWDPATIS